MPPPIVIRPARTHTDYLALQNAQRAAWRLTDEAYVIPIATLVGANLHGGLVLGAFDEHDHALGLSVAFLGRVDGTLCLYSQVTGVVPELQDAGIGTRLKLAQRDFALREGLPAIAWAFDPLRSGNARFNLNKLGAQATQFYVDMYGPRTDALNTNTPTDRLLAWWPVSSAPRRRFDAAEVAALARIDPARPIAWDAAAARIDLPGTEPGAVSISARQTLRAAFLAAFARGWRATDFVTHGPPSAPISSFVLQPQPALAGIDPAHRA